MKTAIAILAVLLVTGCSTTYTPGKVTNSDLRDAQAFSRTVSKSGQKNICAGDECRTVLAPW